MVMSENGCLSSFALCHQDPVLVDTVLDIENQDIWMLLLSESNHF